MANETPFGIEQATLYFSTVTAGATPAAANQLGEFEGEPVTNGTYASAMFRGQNRVATEAFLHDGDFTATIPGMTFDSSIVLTKLMNGTATAATTLHGGAAAAREDKIGKNSKPLIGEWLLEGLNTQDGKKVQVLYHKAFITSVSPTHGRTGFAKLDVNLTCLADASGDVVSVFHAS